MKYREPDVERIVAVFIEKIDDVIAGWTDERDAYKAYYREATRDYRCLVAAVLEAVDQVTADEIFSAAAKEAAQTE